MPKNASGRPRTRPERASSRLTWNPDAVTWSLPPVSDPITSPPSGHLSSTPRGRSKKPLPFSAIAVVSFSSSSSRLLLHILSFPLSFLLCVLLSVLLSFRLLVLLVFPFPPPHSLHWMRPFPIQMFQSLVLMRWKMHTFNSFACWRKSLHYVTFLLTVGQ